MSPSTSRSSGPTSATCRCSRCRPPQVLGGNVSGTARIEDHAVVLPGATVTGRGRGLNRNAGSFYGYVDTATAPEAIDDVTLPPPYTWRQ